MSEVMLAGRQLSLKYGNHTVLNEVSIDIRAGEVVALVGPNGAGKSTLLSVLTGDTDADSGTVELAGQPLDDWGVGQMARLRAVQLQENKVSFAFTASEVVRLGRAAWRGTEEEKRDDAVVYTVMESTEVAPLAQRAYPTLSGGEKARATFARALAQETPVLLLDEPTAAMDIRHQEHVLREVRARADAGAAVVVVLHDLSVAAAYADRMVLINDGIVAAQGTPREVLTPETISEVYGHPVLVLEHEDAGGLVVVPIRRGPESTTESQPATTHGQPTAPTFTENPS